MGRKLVHERDRGNERQRERPQDGPRLNAIHQRIGNRIVRQNSLNEVVGLDRMNIAVRNHRPDHRCRTGFIVRHELAGLQGHGDNVEFLSEPLGDVVGENGRSRPRGLMGHKQNGFSTWIQARAVEIELIRKADRPTVLSAPLRKIVVDSQKRLMSRVGIALKIVFWIEIRRRSQPELLANDDVVQHRVEIAKTGHLPFVVFDIEQFTRANDRSNTLARRAIFERRPVGGTQRQIGQDRRVGKSPASKIGIEPGSLKSFIGLKSNGPSGLQIMLDQLSAFAGPLGDVLIPIGVEKATCLDKQAGFR